MNQQSLQESLEKHAVNLGVPLLPQVWPTIYKYLELLEKWGARIRLYSAKSATELLDRHIADGMALLPHIPTQATHLIDVGSGAGFTAVPAAIFRPSLTVTALEPAYKKHAFLSAVRRELPLANLHPHPIKLNEYLKEPLSANHDVAVSRATWPLLEWLVWGTDLVRNRHGRVLGMEGLVTHPLPPGASRHPYTLAGRTRSIIVYRPEDSQPLPRS